jgi:glycosyltransferase involved in cell wall biosynthesis
MMRILYLVTRADMGGAQVHILDLLHGLPASVDAVVGVGEEGYLTVALQRMGVPHFVLPNLVHPISPVKDYRAVMETVRLIRSTRAHIVHAHTSKAGIVGRVAAHFCGVPSVFTAHTWCFAEGTSWKWRYAGIPAERLAGFWSSAIINVSEENRRLAMVHRIAGANRMVVIWNGIPENRQRSRPDDAVTPRIVMVARFVEQKDQSLLLRAVARLDRPVILTLIGDGPRLAAARAEADDLGLTDRVEFLGQRYDVAQLLATSHIFALISNWEGFPLSILEAMRAGLPVVASDVGGVREAVIEGETGFAVRCGDVAEVQERLRELVDNPVLRRKMGDAGHARYRSHFTLESMVRKTVAVYEAIAAGMPLTRMCLTSEISTSGGWPVHTRS